jgi:hypothetical protein
VAELAGEPVRSPLQRPVRHDAAPDSRAQRDQHHVVAPVTGSEQPFGHRRAGRIVVDVDVGAESVRQQLGDCEVGDAIEVRRRTKDTGTRDQARHADADAPLPADLVGQLDHDVDQCVKAPIAPWRRTLRRLDHLTRTVDHHGLRLGATHVDPDTAGRQGTRRRAGGHASARTFSSRTVLRMRTSARRLTNPGNGIARSICRS